MKHYLIDGNNLIGKIKSIARLQVTDKQRSREKLAFLLERFFTGKKNKATLFFDGHPAQSIKTGKVKIIYSEDRTADELIKDKIELTKNRRNLIVISSDREVSEFGRVCGCGVIKSEDFGKEISASKREDEEKKRIEEMNNIEEFKKIFNIK